MAYNPVREGTGHMGSSSSLTTHSILYWGLAPLHCTQFQRVHHPGPQRAHNSIAGPGAALLRHWNYLGKRALWELGWEYVQMGSPQKPPLLLCLLSKGHFKPEQSLLCSKLGISPSQQEPKKCLYCPFLIRHAWPSVIPSTKEACDYVAWPVLVKMPFLGPIQILQLPLTPQWLPY
jgi:hypothetical protein